MRFLFLTLLFAATIMAQPIRQEKSVKLYEPPESARSHPPAGRVRALIRQLAASSPDVHAAAERELLSLCPMIEPQLRFALAEEERSAPAPLPTAAPLHQEFVRGGGFSRFQPADLQPRGVFHSLTALVEHCEELRHTTPSLITLNAVNASLADIFGQLGRQTGAPVRVRARSYDGAVDPAALDWFQSARVTLHLNRVEYWAALRAILRVIHPPDLKSVQLFIDIGNNNVELIPQRTDSVDVFRNPDAVRAGPMLLQAYYQLSPNPRLTVAAVVDPALNGFTGDSSLHLTSLSDDEGRSLIQAGDNTSSSGGLEQADHDDMLGYAFDPADGKFSWRQRLPIDLPPAGRTVAAAAGTFSIGFGVDRAHTGTSQNIGIPLAPFHPESLSTQPEEEQIYLLQDCKILLPPSVDKPVYGRIQEQDHLDCKAHAFDRRGGTSHETIEGVVLTVTNHRDHPVTYVTSLTYFVEPAPGFPKPDQIVETVAIYHAHAEPGQTVEIRMATQYQLGTRSPIAPTPEKLPAPPSRATPQTVVYDGWRINVLSVSYESEAYVITGQLALPIAGPFGDTEASPGYIFLNPLDAQGWQIESYAHFSKIRREGDHLVEDFSVVTREPGRIPEILVWQAPSATHWLSTRFEIRHLNRFHSSAKD